MTLLLLAGAIGPIAGLRGQAVHEESPILNTSLPLPGWQLYAGGGDPAVGFDDADSLSSPAAGADTAVEEVEGSGLVPGPAWELLKRAVLDCKMSLLSGGTRSGKTLLAPALLNFLLEASLAERLVIVEVVAREIMLPPALNVSRLLTSEAGRITIARLVGAPQWLNPNRIIPRELRRAGALDYVRAQNTGHPWSVFTQDANPAPDALYRLTT